MSEWWSWPFSEIKKHSQYFRARFQSRSLNPQKGRPRRRVLAKVAPVQRPHCPWHLHVQMRAKGKSGWNMLVSAYPQLGCWPESALGSQYKKWDITKLERVKWHRESQSSTRGRQGESCGGQVGLGTFQSSLCVPASLAKSSPRSYLMQSEAQGHSAIPKWKLLTSSSTKLGFVTTTNTWIAARACASCYAWWQGTKPPSLTLLVCSEVLGQKKQGWF